MKILIAEDDRISRSFFQKFMSSYGACDIAVDGMEALDLYMDAVKAEIEKDPEAESRLQNLDALINAVKEYEDRCHKGEKEPSVADFLPEISLLSGEDDSNAGEGGAVTLMTVHLAKGLEFNNVFVIFPDMFATWWIWDVLTDHKANIRLSETDILSGQYPFWLNQQSYEELMKLSGNKKW